jgi:Trk K+ transport system NAD-binding subunit
MLHAIRKWLSVQSAKNAHLLILLGIVVFNVLLWLVASLVAYFIDQRDFPDYGAALATSIAWLLDPGTYDSTTPFAVRLTSVIVIVTAMVTFSGGIIAYVASVFSSIIENSKKGRGKLYLDDHIVILNWNSEAPELICDFGFRDDKEDIVVISGVDKEAVERQIKNKAFEKGKKLRHFDLMVRTGSVFSEAVLDAAGVKEARAVIILRNEGLPSEDADILSLKTMMMVLSMIKRKEETVIVEVARKETADLIKADAARHEQVIPILAGELMGHLIAQAILVPKISDAYSEIFSYEGAEFYELPFIAEEEALKTYSSLIPVEENGHTFALAEGIKDLSKRRKTPYVGARRLSLKEPLRGESRQVVVFGKSSKRPYIEESIRLFSLDSGEKTDIAFIEEADPAAIREALENLSGVDTILILSDDSLPEERLDSKVLFTLLLIKDLAKEKKIKVIVEILNQRHQEIAQKYDVENIIVSTTYISHMITQISENRDLFPLFEDLLTYDDGKDKDASYEIYTYGAKEFLETAFPLTFGSISEFVSALYRSSDKKVLGIGVIHAGKTSLFKGDLDKKPLTIDADDRIVVIDK